MRYVPLTGQIFMPPGVTSGRFSLRYGGLFKGGNVIASGGFEGLVNASGNLTTLDSQTVTLPVLELGEQSDHLPYVVIDVSWGLRAIGFSFRVDLVVTPGDTELNVAHFSVLDTRPARLVPLDYLSVRRLTFKGIVASHNSLSQSAGLGDTWVSSDTSHLWAWSGSEWVDLGPVAIPGPKGDTGLPGPNGRSVVSLSMNQFGHLLAQFSDGTTQDAGPMPALTGNFVTPAQLKESVAEMFSSQGTYNAVLGKVVLSIPQPLSSENVQDIVANLIKAGPGMTVAYDDANNTLTLSSHNDASVKVSWERLLNKPLGVPDGVATLNSSGKIPDSQLPEVIKIVPKSYSASISSPKATQPIRETVIMTSSSTHWSEEFSAWVCPISGTYRADLEVEFDPTFPDGEWFEFGVRVRTLSSTRNSIQTFRSITSKTYRVVSQLLTLNAGDNVSVLAASEHNSSLIRAQIQVLQQL